MRIIFFNIWHGQVWDKFSNFVIDENKNTDVFCLTEVDPELQVKLANILTGYKSFYKETTELLYPKREIDGHSIFLRDNIKVEFSGKEFIAPISDRDVGCLQYIKLNLNGKKLFIGNVHGMSLPGTKIDTPDRINQSKKIIEYFDDKVGPRIIGGDFNLLPETESVKMFEDASYKNLIKEFGIKNTRNKLSWEQFQEEANYEKQYFADYCFVSLDVKVNNFEVPNIEASDHEPLILDFEI